MSRVVSREHLLKMRLWLAAGLLLLGTVASGSSQWNLPRDGWVRWQVPAIADAPDWCCFEVMGSRSKNGICRLDSSGQGYGSSDSRSPVDTMRIYARFEDGKLTRVRALGPSCPVETRDAIVDLGDQPVDDSARWLTTQLDPRADTANDVLAALAVHAGRVAHDHLVDIARRNADIETRKEAVFWMGLVRSSDSADDLESIMFGDTNADVRQHAAFAMSQSSIPDRVSALTKLGRDDADPDVRAKAWFWLAQTGSPAVETAIMQAMKTDADPDVREQAVFALSLLPGERAVTALGAIVKDADQPRELRKRALFWLGLNDSPQAQAYLAEVLADD